MKTASKLLTLVCLFGGITNIHAQSQLTNPFLNSGRQYFYQSGARELYTDLKGEPFLLKDWAKGSITTEFAQTDNLNMLYNEVEDQLIFKVKRGDVKKVIDPVKEFNIIDSENGNKLRNFKAGFDRTNFSSEKTFFEVLADGKVKLLKKNWKHISQNREYSGKIAQTVMSYPNYYLVFDDNVPVKLKANKKSLTNQFGSKLKDVNQYIETNQINLKHENDVLKLVNYYNSL